MKIRNILSILVAFLFFIAPVVANEGQKITFVVNGEKLDNDTNVTIGSNISIHWELNNKDENNLYTNDYILKLRDNSDNETRIMHNYVDNSGYDILNTGNLILGKSYQLLIGKYIYCWDCEIPNIGNNGHHHIEPMLESTRFNIVLRDYKTETKVSNSTVQHDQFFGKCDCDRVRILRSFLNNTNGKTHSPGATLHLDSNTVVVRSNNTSGMSARLDSIVRGYNLNTIGEAVTYCSNRNFNMEEPVKDNYILIFDQYAIPT